MQEPGAAGIMSLQKGGTIMRSCMPWCEVSEDSLLSWLKCINSIRLNVPLCTFTARRAVESLKVLKNLMFYAEQI